MHVRQEAGDWAALPEALAVQIVRDLCSGHQDARAVARLLSPLGASCRRWRQAVQLTLLSVRVGGAAAVRPGATLWLSRLSLEGLAVSHALAGWLAGDTAFFAAVLGPSAPTLRLLTGVPSLALLPPLGALRCLRTLGLHAPHPSELPAAHRRHAWVEDQPLATVDLSLLRALASLTSLSVSGHYRLAGLDCLPPGLTHLSLSNLGGQLSVGAYPCLTLPPGLRLARLQLKARVVALSDFPLLCRQARSVHVVASRLLVGLPAAPRGGGGDAGGTAGPSGRSTHLTLAGLADAPELRMSLASLAEDGGPDLALYRAFAAATAAAGELEQAALHFHKMQLHTSVPSSRGGAAPQWASAAAADDPWPGDVDGSVTARSWPQQEVVSAWVNGYEIVEVLRRELMCSHRVSSCYASCNLDSDSAAPNSVASVLRIERQPEAAGKHMWLMTPASPREQAMLLNTPLESLEWCRDPFVLPLLRSPAFIANSGPTLRMLGPIPLNPGLDLSPFSHLTELHGLLEPSSLAAPMQLEPAAAGAGRPAPGAVVLPRSLRLLGLQAEAWPATPHFDAAAVAALTCLHELRLGCFATHDMRAVPATLGVLTISNPRATDPACPALGGACLQLPGWGAGARPALATGQGPGVSGSGSSSSWLAARRRVAGRALLCFGGGQDGKPIGDGPSDLPHMQPGSPTATLAAGAGSAEWPAPAAPAHALHLHITSSTAAEVAVDLSWCLTQPALRRLTVSGSCIRPGQRLRLLVAAGGLGTKGAAARELAHQLAASPALESLAINLNLATAVLETSAPRLLQQLGAAPRCQPLDRALSTAARAFPTAATAAHGGWGGTGIVRSSVSSTRSSGSSRGGRDRIGRPGAGGCEEGRWGVESWVPKEPVQGSEEGKGFEWVEGVQKGARGLRAVCRVAN